MALGRLTITPPLAETAVHTLDAPELIVGRSPQADITIPDPLISQQHARITSDGDALWIEDLGSTNGVFVNGLRLTPGIPVPLPDGAKLEMGDSTLQFSAAPLMPLDATLITRSPLDDTLTPQPDAPFWKNRWVPAGGLALLGLLILIAAFLLWPRPDTPPAITADTTATSTATSTLPPPAVSRTRIEPCPEPPMLPIVPPSFTAVAANQPANPALYAIPLLELPFPYDGGNENFGGTGAQFRAAVQRSFSGGRINSFFDHFYPLYPAPTDASSLFGREPAEPPIGGSVLMFDGQLSGGDYYSGHPAYDFSTFIPRQPATPVFAAADGVVYDVGQHSSGALFVKLVHAVPDVGDFLTIYWHLNPDEFFQAMQGRQGETITAGTRIGTMGNTGWSSGHHLHFEVRFDRNGDGAFTADESVDPFGFIPSPTYPADPWGQPVSFTDGRGNLYTHAASVSPYLWRHPLGAAVQILESGGGQVPLAGVGGEGGLCAPARSLPPGGTVFYSYAPDPPPTPNLAGTGEGCVLSAIAPDGSPATSFDTAARVELPYNPAEFSHLDPDTVAIYWQDAGSSDWYPLPTQFDEERGVAAAESSKPGHCALLGQPTQDVTKPRTSIEVSGERGVDGAFYDVVTVSASASDAGGVAKIEYSLDAGDTWRLYTGPFTLAANGIPEPLPDEMEEDFGSGPGRFLVLFSTTDTAGNVEEPPAFRRIVIDPSKAPPPETTPTPTPTFTLTPSPTTCVPRVTAVLNANVRWGPGLIYEPPVAAMAVGESAPILGKNSDGSWWQIDLNPNAATQFWVADSVAEINCGREDVPVAATPVPPTFTPTPTQTPTSTPTSTPTTTPTPTRTRIPDKRPPGVSASHSPTLVWENSQVTFTATASDNVGVARMEIWIRPSANALWVKAKTCLDATFCTYLGGPYTPGTVTYIAYAWDAADNVGNSGQISFNVLSIPQ